MFLEWLELVQDHTREDLADDAEQGDTVVVITVTVVSFVFVQCCDVGVTHVLWDQPFLLALEQEFVEVAEENSPFAGLDDFRWNAITTWSFAIGEGVDGFAESLEGGWATKFIQDWHGGDALNCCVGDNVFL